MAHVSLVGSDMHPVGGFYPIVNGSIGLYGTKDGRALLWSESPTAEVDKLFGEVCAFGGHPELGTDKRFVPLGNRCLGEDRQNEIRPLLAEVFRGRTLAEWKEFLGIPVRLQ